MTAHLLSLSTPCRYNKEKEGGLNVFVRGVDSFSSRSCIDIFSRSFYSPILHTHLLPYSSNGWLIISHEIYIRLTRENVCST